MNPAWLLCVQVRQVVQCHICSVHHLGKGDRLGAEAILGSTALHAAVDTALMLHKRDAQPSISRARPVPARASVLRSDSLARAML